MTVSKSSVHPPPFLMFLKRDRERDINIMINISSSALDDSQSLACVIIGLIIVENGNQWPEFKS